MSVSGDNLSDVDILALDYDEKVKLLEKVVQDTLKISIEFAELSGRYAELKAKIAINKLVGSHLQSAIKAERAM